MWDSWKAGYSCKELTPLERCKNTEQLLGGTKNYSGYASPQSEAEKSAFGDWQAFVFACKWADNLKKN